MDTATAQRVVLVGGVITFGIGWYNAARKGNQPSAKFIVGAGMTYAALSVLSDFEPAIAGPLAIAITTTALFSEGKGALAHLNKRGELDHPPASATVDKPHKPTHPIHVAH